MRRGPARRRVRGARRRGLERAGGAGSGCRARWLRAPRAKAAAGSGLKAVSRRVTPAGGTGLALRVGAGEGAGPCRSTPGTCPPLEPGRAPCACCEQWAGGRPPWHRGLQEATAPRRRRAFIPRNPRDACPRLCHRICASFIDDWAKGSHRHGLGRWHRPAAGPLRRTEAEATMMAGSGEGGGRSLRSGYHTD